MSSTENWQGPSDAERDANQDGGEGRNHMNDDQRHPITGRKRLLKQIATDYFAAIGICAASVIGVVIPIFPDILPNQRPEMFVTTLIACAFYPAFRAWPRTVQHTYKSDRATPQTTIRIIKGDLFDSGDNLVIGMPDTFDTESHIIAPTSVHGIFQSRVYGGDIALVDAELDAALSGNPNYQDIPKDQRPNGKRRAYELGTVAVLTRGGKRYLCVACTTMSRIPNKHKVSGDVVNLWKTLGALWSEARDHVNNEPIRMPVMSTKFFGTDHILPMHDAIRLLALSYLVACRERRVTTRLDIVVLEDAYADLDLRELQAFLDSLDLS